MRASSNDGTFRRVGKDGGRWWSENWQDENLTGALVLAWTNWPKEKLHTQDGGKTFSCAGLTKWKYQEEPYKFELKLPAKVKHAPAWIRTMEEPTYSYDSDSDSDSDTSYSDAGGSALPAADGAMGELDRRALLRRAEHCAEQQRAAQTAGAAVSAPAVPHRSAVSSCAACLC